MPNPYCAPLHITVPSLEAVKDHRDAVPYSLLIVALLERGAPMTLPEVAARFAEAGIAPADQALPSLKRCRPARSPVYRHGDHYELDPHDDELDLWAFRLGLRPPAVPSLRIVPPPAEPLPGPDVPLTINELNEALRSAWLANWSALRVAVAALDAHGGRMSATELIAKLDALCKYHPVRESSAKYWRRGAAIVVNDDGTWTMDPAHSSVPAARKAVRDRIDVNRRNADTRSDPAVLAASRKRYEAKQAAEAEELARLRRVIVHAFPAGEPEAVVLVDVATRELHTFLGPELTEVPTRIGEFDLVAAIDVRPLLRTLGCDPVRYRLADLGPPQKTVTLNQRRRTLKLNTELFIQGSCGISKPFGSPTKLRTYLERGQTTRLRRRLESDAKSLFALYQYGRLHRGVRLQWGFLDEDFPVPWTHRSEPALYALLQSASEQARILEIVEGNAPSWSEPWSRLQRCQVLRQAGSYDWHILSEDGHRIAEPDIQLARLGEPLPQ